MCKECENGEVEDLGYFVMRCKYLAEERSKIERLMIDRVNRWNELGDNEKEVIVMDRACRDKAVAKAIEKLSKKRFVSAAPLFVAVPHQP